MIAELKPYSEYKQSGLPWLGRVPAHWEIRPAFGAYVPNHERNFGMKERTVLSLSYGRIVIKPAENLHGLVPESFQTYQVVNPGDIVLRTTDLQNDHTSLRVGIVRDRGIITSAYLALRVNAGVNPDFGFQFLNVWDMSKAIYGYGSGLRQNLAFSHFKRMPVALPPLGEQVLIVRFLDWVNGRLERSIRAKRKVIALLNERKQAIIHRAVTQSFVEHLPLNILCLPKEERTVPGWQSFSVRRLMQLRLLAIQDGNHGELHPKASDYVDAGIPFLMANNVRPEGLDLNGCAKIRERQARGLRIGFAYPGDVLLTHKATIGQIGLVPEDLKAPFVMLTPQVTYYRSSGTRILGKYLFLFMQSPLFQEQLKVLSLNQSTRPYIGLIEQRNLVICFPSIDKQSQMCAEFKHSLAPVESARLRADREIELLREYRTRLVADVVTGKLDVREAAARLPAEVIPDIVEVDADLSDDREAADAIV